MTTTTAETTSALVEEELSLSNHNNNNENNGITIDGIGADEEQEEEDDDDHDKYNDDNDYDDVITTNNNENIINGSSISMLRKAADDIVSQTTQRSESLFVDINVKVDRIPKFHISEITTGRVIGRGGFCVVNDINSIQLKDNNTNTGTKSINNRSKSKKFFRGPFSFKGVRGRISSSSSNDSSVRSKSSTDSFIENSFKNNNRNKKNRFIIKQLNTGSNSEDEDEEDEDGGDFSNHVDNNSARNTNINNNNGAYNNKIYYTREDIASKCLLKNRRPRFVMKTLSDFGDYEDDNDDYGYATHENESKYKARFIKGTVDIAMEVKFLSALNHPNIIKLRGLSYSSPFHTTTEQQQSQSRSYDSFSNSKNNFFLIIDKLVETLPRRISKRWTTIDRQTKGITGTLTGGGKKKRNDLLVDKLLAAYDICSAMSYLHSHKVMYRDLKPDNIGFDTHDNIKLFDFGLAKELNSKDRIKEDGDDDVDSDSCSYRNMTGFTGAIRYMSPENGLKQPYGLKSDVYSFGMCFWYIMALEPPFVMYTTKMIYERVISGGNCGSKTRPLTFHDWSDNVCSVMTKCWDDNPYKRPTFEQIKNVLRQEIWTIRGGPTSSPDVLDLSRSSSIVGGGGGTVSGGGN